GLARVGPAGEGDFEAFVSRALVDLGGAGHEGGLLAEAENRVFREHDGSGGARGSAAYRKSDETPHGPRCGNGSFPFHGRQYIMPQILCALWTENSRGIPAFWLSREPMAGLRFPVVPQCTSI